MPHPYTRSEILRGAKDALPVMFAVAPYAMVLGAQASQVGLSLSEVGAMTGLNFAGGSEFAAIKLWAAVPPMLTIVLITLLINSRHIVMGASLAPYLQHLPRRKVIPALFFMADEGWAISYADTTRRALAQQQPAFSWPYYWGACLPFYPVWVGFAVLGAVLGPEPNGVAGAAVALVAVFLPGFLILIGVLPFWERLRRNARIQAALLGINAAVVGLLLAALYQPVWTSAIHAPQDVALALAALVALMGWKLPPWLVVLGCGALGGLLGGAQ